MATKAMIRNLETKEEFPVLFNPTEYSLSKSNNWSQVSIRKFNVPLTDFTGGNPTELKIQLFLDTYELGEDVRKHTNKIIKLTEVSEQSDGFRPPRCMFSWGKVFNFVSVITSLSYKYTLFLDDGTPVRATMDLTFRECEDVGVKKGQQSPPQGIPGYKVVIVTPGDTIDSISAREYGDPKLWRYIANVNRLDNPRNLKPGQALAMVLPEFVTNPIPARWLLPGFRPCYLSQARQD